MSSIRVLQLENAGVRRLALVDEPDLELLDLDSSFALASSALAADRPLGNIIDERRTGERIPYDAVYAGTSVWRVRPPIDHPVDPARVLVSGTGLTHLGSAQQRDAMHEKSEAEMTDSMRMFRWGLDGGRPPEGQVGPAPEWFYKGNGTILRAHNEPLVVPPHAEDGGEEAELAGVYVVDGTGRPVRVGMCAGNEFSDHKFERRNYLNLAGSKLRTCSLGPELVLNPEFQSVRGTATIERKGLTIWHQDIVSGEAEMCHSLANIEHHHFKFDAHRRAGDVHVHFYGAHSLSFGAGVELAAGDVVVIQFVGFGRPLRNPIQVSARVDSPVTVKSLK
jgi:hypothetical protein